MKFKKNFLVQVIESVLIGLVIANSSAIAAQVKSLDSKVKHLVLQKEDCISANEACLLQVTPTVGSHGEHLFDVSQLCDTEYAQIQYLYAMPMKEQITQRKFLGNKLCSGVVSISNMSLPFSKNSKVLDGNDGLLLADTAESSMKDVSSLLATMRSLAKKAASGTYSPTQMADLNVEFSMLLCEINRIANVTSFNGISLLNGSTDSIDVTVNKGKRHISLRLKNLTTGSSGLNIASLTIETIEAAKASLTEVSRAKKDVQFGIDKVELIKPRLREAVEQDAEITSVDLNETIFTVTREGNIV